MLHDEEPREQVGRDTISRFRAQIRSAAIASLEILGSNQIDRVYCDFHDDFVVRIKIEDEYKYRFYQVKTKKKLNNPWEINDVFGLLKKHPEKSTIDNLKNSFIGKLLLHTIKFEKSCLNIIFQTNIHNGDEIEKLESCLKKNDFTNKFISVLIDKFNDCYSTSEGATYEEDDIKRKLLKLKFETDVQHLKENDNFSPTLRNKIYEYSEIDLSRIETDEIILKLLSLVESKSSGIIDEITQDNIETQASICIDDLLKILSITPDAYYILINGQDPKAIKSASIIQRTLSKAGATPESIKFCSQCKIDWDLWVRNNRHSIEEFNYQLIIDIIRGGFSQILNNHEINLTILRGPIIDILNKLKEIDLKYNLDEKLILGSFFSILVREKS